MCGETPRVVVWVWLDVCKDVFGVFVSLLLLLVLLADSGNIVIYSVGVTRAPKNLN